MGGQAAACQEDKEVSIVSLILLMFVYYGASYVSVPTWGVVMAEKHWEQWLHLDKFNETHVDKSL